MNHPAMNEDELAELRQAPEPFWHPGEWYVTAMRLLATLDLTLAALDRLSKFVNEADPAVLDAWRELHGGDE